LPGVAISISCFQIVNGRPVADISFVTPKPLDDVDKCIRPSPASVIPLLLLLLLLLLLFIY